MAQRHNNLVAYDGTKAVTIWGDEGWSILSGNDKERPDTEIYYAARVPIVFRGMQIRSDAVASIPFDLVNINTGDIIDTSDDWENNIGFIDDPHLLFWLIEAAWVISGRSYCYRSSNNAGIVKVFRPLAPATITYNLNKNEFTRKVSLTGNVTEDKIFQTALDDKGRWNPGEAIIPLWMPDPDVEKGPPLKFPGKAALHAMGVLFNMDDASNGFFKRGMLHTYAFSVPPGTQQADKEAFEDKVRNVLTGVKNAWRTIFLNVKDVQPIDLGGGLEELANIPLTKEKREDVSIALGIPMSILFSEAAAGLGGKGVVNADDKRLIEITALPDWKKIAYQLNKQLFIPMGYRLVEHHEKMSVFQENESERATALTAYVNAFNTDPKLANILAKLVGLKIPEELQAELDEIIKGNEPPEVETPEQEIQPLAPGGVMPTDPLSQFNNTPDMVGEQPGKALASELDKFRRKAVKALERGKSASVEFESAIIPPDEMERITRELALCRTVEQIKDVFQPVKQGGDPFSIAAELVLAMNRATHLLDKNG
jgi:hypothetical protein